MRQVEINFESGLPSQFPYFRDVVKAAVYGCGRPFKAVAADNHFMLLQVVQISMELTPF